MEISINIFQKTKKENQWKILSPGQPMNPPLEVVAGVGELPFWGWLLEISGSSPRWVFESV